MRINLKNIAFDRLWIEMHTFECVLHLPAMIIPITTFIQNASAIDKNMKDMQKLTFFVVFNGDRYMINCLR